ncbi:MAG TPA: lipid II flippase MurJ [Candidatus Saccharibacteria bacterium]|nr:virulence factor MviN [Candidatus Saccharibacteria bacterium]MCB9817636.1 virulence factor MviN [Candidatus Nomurabacteria bacterium]HPD98840.1 lipid II flippase MurJ [Candidatus Saccharibacteria bacterium]HPR09966.1 lipid II flippase MurJ [Candidatus Saccharibacteria bacterium]
MNRFLNRANKRISLGTAAALLAGTSFLGIFLGILRTKLINANFNVFTSDAYFAAFKIPDFIFFTLASGALGVAFLPILSDRLAKNRQSAWEVSSYILNFLGLIALVASILLMLLADPLMRYVVAPGFTPQQLELSVSIMRIVSVNVFIFSISTILSTVQQAVGRFFFIAIAPLFYNTSIIASIFIFGDSLGIVGLSLGVALGSILQLLVVALGMAGLKFKYTPLIDFKNQSFREVLRVLPARAIDQGVDSINAIVETRFASRLLTGSVTWYENALVLHFAPISLIGNSISTAAFPRLTDRLAQGRTDLFRKEFIKVLRTMIWIALPVVVVSFFARAYLARIIFARSSSEIAMIFGFLSVAIFFRIIYTIISRYFYAHKDTKTPLYVSLFVIALNVFLAYTLSKPSAYGVAGLAIAQSIVALTEVMILVAIMIQRDRKLFTGDFVQAITRMIAITGFSAFATYVAIQFFPLLQTDTGFVLMIKLGIITSITFTVHTAMSYVFDMPEARAVVQKVRTMALAVIKV